MNQSPLEEQEQKQSCPLTHARLISVIVRTGGRGERQDPDADPRDKTKTELKVTFIKS